MSDILSRAQTAPMQVYADHLARGELAYQYSVDAQKAVFYPRLVCPFTGSTRLEWRVSSGHGKIHAVTWLHPKGEEPYAVVLVDIAEGFRMMSRIIGTSAEAVRIDAPVVAAIQPSADADGAPAAFFRVVEVQ